MLQAVLLDEKLMEFGNYTEEECLSLDDALCSSNPVVHAVALIIERVGMKYKENEVYKLVSDYLKNVL